MKDGSSGFGSGLNIVITGAASGIGAGLAAAFGSSGARLALVDLRGERLQSSAAHALSFTADVTDPERMRKVASEILSAWGHVDVVIAAAGVGAINPGFNFSAELDHKVMSINHLGTVNTLAPFIASMIARRSGHLVGICSLAALRGLPMGASYSASKAAQMTWLESMRLDLRPFGVGVSCIHPGFVATPMAAHSRFSMPLKVSVESSTRIIMRAIATRKSQTYYPWPMGLLSRLNRVLPNWLYDLMISRLSPARGDAKPELLGFTSDS